VAKQYILEEKCLKKLVETWLLGTRRYNFLSSMPTVCATIHSVADGQTDGKHCDAKSQSSRIG